MLKDFLCHPSVQMKSGRYNQPAVILAVLSWGKEFGPGAKYGGPLNPYFFQTLMAAWWCRPHGRDAGMLEQGQVNWWRDCITWNLFWRITWGCCPRPGLGDGWLAWEQTRVISWTFSVLCCPAGWWFWWLCATGPSLCSAVLGERGGWWCCAQRAKPQRQALIGSLLCTVLLNLHGTLPQTPVFVCHNFLSFHRFVLLLYACGNLIEARQLYKLPAWQGESFFCSVLIVAILGITKRLLTVSHFFNQQMFFNWFKMCFKDISKQFPTVR